MENANSSPARTRVSWRVWAVYGIVMTLFAVTATSIAGDDTAKPTAWPAMGTRAAALPCAPTRPAGRAVRTAAAIDATDAATTSARRPARGLRPIKTPKAGPRPQCADRRL